MGKMRIDHPQCVHSSGPGSDLGGSFVEGKS